MNKQQLAAKIWESANRMRGKVDASEYKDFILGFIFYKYLSEKEEQFFLGEGMTAADMEQLVEEDEETVGYAQNHLGYFISYQNLFSTWIQAGNDFAVSQVYEALSAFSRLVSPLLQKRVRRHLHHATDGTEQARRQYRVADESRARSRPSHSDHPHEHAPRLRCAGLHLRGSHLEVRL